MDNERTNVQNFQNLKFAQHNCWKFINVMQSILKHVKRNSLNLMLIQKSWIQNDENHNNMIIFYSNFTCIIFKIKKYKSCVATFVNKCKKNKMNFKNWFDKWFEYTNFEYFHKWFEKCQKSKYLQWKNPKFRQSNKNQWLFIKHNHWKQHFNMWKF